MYDGKECTLAEVKSLLCFDAGNTAELSSSTGSAKTDSGKITFKERVKKD